MKIFSYEKYKKDMGYTDETASDWAKKVAGMPVDEIKEKFSYEINDAWIEEDNMKFKIGDRVKIVRPYLIDEGYKGDIVTISKIDKDDSDRFFVKENNRPWRGRELELVKEFKMTKKDLKDGDIVTLKNGDKLVLTGEEFYELTGDSHYIDDLDDYVDDLTCDCTCHSEYDIVKVERPVEYETVFERAEVQELTVDEISERLGYKVKVVGEDR